MRCSRILCFLCSGWSAPHSNAIWHLAVFTFHILCRPLNTQYAVNMAQMRRAHKIRLITIIYANFYIALQWNYAVMANLAARYTYPLPSLASHLSFGQEEAAISQPFRLTVLLIAFARAPGKPRRRVEKRWRCRCDTDSNFHAKYCGTAMHVCTYRFTPMPIPAKYISIHLEARVCRSFGLASSLFTSAYWNRFIVFSVMRDGRSCREKQRNAGERCFECI